MSAVQEQVIISVIKTQKYIFMCKIILNLATKIVKHFVRYAVTAKKKG